MSGAGGAGATAEYARVLRQAAEQTCYRPSLADWGVVEDCVDEGLLAVRELDGETPGTIASFAYVITPRGLATLANGPDTED